MQTTISLDYESSSEVDLRGKGLDLYSADRSTEIILCAYSYDRGPIHLWDKATGRPFPRDVKEALEDPYVIKKAFNAQFERVMTRRVLMVKTPYEGWRCTMAKAYLNSFTGGLGDIGQQMQLSEEKQKDPEGYRLIRLFSMPQKVTDKQPHRWRDWRTDPADWDLFGKYCIKDVAAETAIDRALDPFPIPDDEWELYEIDQRINDRGLPIDRNFVANAIEMTNRRRAELMAEMRDLTGLANPNSVQQLLKWVRDRGYPFEDLGKDTIKKALTEDEETLAMPEDCERALRLRLNASRMSTQKYNTLLNILGKGDWARFLFQFAGASRTARWAGRKVQPQNLPHTPKSLEDIEDLTAATNAIRAGDYGLLGGYIDEPMDAFVGLIRSSIRAPEGRELVVCDLSAIESRVLAWLSNCQRKLRVFAEGKDPYKDFGTELFQKAYDDITKAERNKSKPPELGCGYRLGGGEIKEGKKTGLWGYAEKMGIPMDKDEAHRAVQIWRTAYPEVPEFWYALENAVVQTIRSGKPTRVGHLRFVLEKPFLSMYLPSGRAVRYHAPRLKKETRQGRNGPYEKLVFSYMGKQQVTNQWTRISSHGGRLAEQCLAADTPVLTPTGYKSIADVSPDDLVWDGATWVGHQGLVYKGERPVIDFGGVRMTPDHLVMCLEGWKESGTCSYAEATSTFGRHYRAPLRNVDGDTVHWFERVQVTVGIPVRLRYADEHASQRVSEKESEILRLRQRAVSLGEPHDPRDDKYASVQYMAEHSRPLLQPQPRRMAQLWRARDYGLPGVEEVVLGVLGGHGGFLRRGFDSGPDRQRGRVFQAELQMDHHESAKPEHQGEPGSGHPSGSHARGGSVRAFRDRSDNTSLSIECRRSDEPVIRPTESTEQVFDLLDAGPRNRFTVRGADGQPFLVHNCTQAMARDVLKVGMLRAAREGFPQIGTVHDEQIVLARVGSNEHSAERLRELMIEPIDWAPGLPLDAGAFASQFYRKD